MFYITMFLRISMLFVRVALPSNKTTSTQEIDSDDDENGAVSDASAELNDIPMSAYLIASQSFDPSPIIPIIKFIY